MVKGETVIVDPMADAERQERVRRRQKRYWHRNLALTGALLLLWFVVTFVAAYHARALNELTLFGFPFGFYMGAQGALIVYVAIIGVYAYAMNRLDAEYDDAAKEDKDTTADR